MRELQLGMVPLLEHASQVLMFLFTEETRNLVAWCCRVLCDFSMRSMLEDTGGAIA
jgi:hypothetical protein